MTITVVAQDGNGTSGALDVQDVGLVAVVHFGVFDAVFGGAISGAFGGGHSDIETSVANRVGRLESSQGCSR